MKVFRLAKAKWISIKYTDDMIYFSDTEGSDEWQAGRLSLFEPRKPLQCQVIGFRNVRSRHNSSGSFRTVKALSR